MLMNEEELRQHLVGPSEQGMPTHSMGYGEPYNVHRIKGFAALRARHIQDHDENSSMMSHTHEPAEGVSVEHDHSSGDEAGGMLVSELFDMPAKPRIQRVFHDRRM